MLTYRTNVLLDKDDHSTLSYLASKENKTISQLIRHAIKITYSDDFDPLKKRKKLLSDLKKLGRQVNTKNINYKELAHHGHKY
jgi:hypothetical protein